MQVLQKDADQREVERGDPSLLALRESVVMSPEAGRTEVGCICIYYNEQSSYIHYNIDRLPSARHGGKRAKEFDNFAENYKNHIQDLSHNFPVLTVFFIFHGTCILCQIIHACPSCTRIMFNDDHLQIPLPLSLPPSHPTSPVLRLTLVW